MEITRVHSKLEIRDGNFEARDLVPQEETTSIEIDWDKVQTIDDIKLLLKAAGMYIIKVDEETKRFIKL